MREVKRRRLEAKGWKFGTAKDFLGLSDDEATYVELKLRPAHAVTCMLWSTCSPSTSDDLTEDLAAVDEAVSP